MQDVFNGNRLQTFLQKFIAGAGYFSPAPLARFTVYFTFFPSCKLPATPDGKKESSFAYAWSESVLQDFSLFVQDITLPNYRVDDSSDGYETILGNVIVNSSYAKPESNVITMRIMNTKTPILENIFYPWLRETTLPYWSYSSQPYTTAKLMISMNDADVAYVFTGVRPQRIDSYHPTHARDIEMTRDVNLIFNYMYITSKDSANKIGEMATKQLDNENKAKAAANNELKNQYEKVTGQDRETVIDNAIEQHFEERGFE